MIAGVKASTIELLRPLARGAHAELLAARSRVDGTPLLIKRLHAGLAEYGEDFVDELVLGIMGRRWPEDSAWLAPLSSVRDGAWRMIVLPWIEAAPLALLLRAGALPAAAVADLGVQLIDALIALARVDPGAIYGELTQAHVLIDRRGHVRIQAACLAPLIHRGGTRYCRGILAVSLPEMHHWPPERVCGKAEDLRGDLYGVGLLLWRALGAPRPFAGDGTFARLQAKLAGERPRLGSVVPGAPATLVVAIESMLARDPAARPELTGAALDHLGLDPDACGGREELARRATAQLDACAP